MDFNINISKLDLSNKKLDKFPDEIFKLKNLRKLNISNNRIKEIPKEISLLKNLENLNVANNYLTNIYSNTCSFKKLHTLILNNNQIKNLPNQISNLSKLKKLLISGNKLNSLPSDIVNLENLTTLDIANNNFTSFPDEIFKLKNLERLWINNNHFIEFPILKIINELQSLKKMYCFGKSLDIINIEIDSEFAKLSRIKGNSLVELKKIVLKDNRKSKTMNSQKNKIFISYAHKDNEWREKVVLFLKSMQFEGIDFEYWSDERILTGKDWKLEIEKSLNDSFIAILIVSTYFLASDFIQSNELPQILENADKKGTKVLPIIARPCRFIQNKNLSKFQAINDPKNPLSKGNEYDVDEILLKLTTDIESYLK